MHYDFRDYTWDWLFIYLYGLGVIDLYLFTDGDSDCDACGSMGTVPMLLIVETWVAGRSNSSPAVIVALSDSGT
jgi:hypothetical protein